MSSTPGWVAIKWLLLRKVNHQYQGQLSLPSLLGWVKAGVFICVGWQVTLCDPIWQVTLRSSEIGYTKSCRQHLTLTFNLLVIYYLR